MKNFKEFCVLVLALIFVQAIRGFVLAKLWNWFIVPLDIKPINFWLAVGIILITDIFTTYRSNINKKQELKEVMEISLRYCFNAFMLLGLGAITHLFV